MADILTKQDGPILRITLNQPDRGNAVSDEMVRELTKIVDGAPKNSSIVVLRGAGKDFCVGRAAMGASPTVPMRSSGAVSVTWCSTAMARCAIARCRLSPWCRVARSASAARSLPPATSRSRATRRNSRCPRWRTTSCPPW